MSEKCTTDLPGSIVQTEILAIELVGRQIVNSPQTLASVVQSAAVQDKIKEVLQSKLRGLQQLALTGRPVDSEQALQTLTSVFTKDALNAAKKELGNQIKKSQSFRELESSLNALKCSFKERPIGVFLDEPERSCLFSLPESSLPGLRECISGSPEIQTL